ncbi:hypothetical protein TUBRATIS_003890 [Tubulinosema ratisbonensis]|uniref:Uncharacterized protein n=1 Tax=Tubulinosema ratisbonensis TaxID=291195 RepID=A0A437APH8_9MICR|nr:hypothetical protein TUBRATIS_003890 [Tubulinosema ratisbonensis]
MNYFTLYIQLYCSSIKRKGNDFAEKIENKRKYIHDFRDIEAAKTMMILAASQNKPSCTTKTLEIQDKGFNDNNVERPKVFYVTSTNRTNNLEEISSIVNPVELIILPDSSQNYVAENTNQTMSYKVQHQATTPVIYNFHIWENLDFNELEKNFQSKSYFNLNYFYTYFYKIQLQITEKCLEEKLYLNIEQIHQLINDKIYNPNVEYFNIEKLDLNFTNFETLISKTEKNYNSLQIEIMKVFIDLFGHGSKIRRFLFVYVSPDLKSKSVSQKDQYLVKALKETFENYFKFEKNPALKIFFPEFEIIMESFYDKSGVYFPKRLFYCVMVIHLKYCFFKKIIGNEIKDELSKNKTINLLNCKYLTYFLLSSKFMIQTLFLNNFIIHAYIRKYIFGNYLLFLKTNDKNNLLNFDSFYILNIFQINFSNFKYYCNLMSLKTEFENIPKKTMSITINGSLDELNQFFDEENNIRILLERILGNEFTHSSDLTLGQLREIFNDSLNKLLLKEFT